MKERRGHHFVPQCILRGFSDQKKKKNRRLNVLDLQAGAWRHHQNLIDVAKERDFYRVNLPGFAGDVIETDLMDPIDGEAAPILRMISCGSLPNSARDWNRLLRFVSMMYLRTRVIRDRQNQMVDILARYALAREATDEAAWERCRSQVEERGVDTAGLNFEFVEGVISGTAMKFEIEPAFRLGVLFRIWPEIFGLFSAKNWSILQAPADSDVICSDDPVALMQSWEGDRGPARTGRTPVAVSARVESASVVLPVDYRTILFGSKLLKSGVYRLRPDQVAAFNTSIALPRRNWIYARKANVMWLDGRDIRGWADLVKRHGEWLSIPGPDEARVNELPSKFGDPDDRHLHRIGRRGIPTADVKGRRPS